MEMFSSNEKIYAKYIPSRTLQYESRDKRELIAAKEAGFTVKVISKDNRAEFENAYPDYILVSDGATELNSSIPKAKKYFLILRNYFMAVKAVYRTDADVISCHDLSPLFMCWIGQLFKPHKASMIYDSHEFEIGRNQKRSKLQLWWITHLERFLIKRCAFSIMVNDCIADEVQRIHHLKERPVVVRSTPDYWEVDEAVCAERRKEFDSTLGTGNFLLMYHGAVMNGRGIETLIDVIVKTEKTAAVILGNGKEEYLLELRKKVEALGVSGRVLFKPAVPVDVLWQYAGAADVGMILAPAVVKNHLYSLPNKFFENIQSETPVICPDYPAMQPIAVQYGIGLTCDPTDLEKVVACVEKMRGDREFYRQCKANLKTAKRELCWENEKKVLLEAFGKL